jgi:hypothetical protein
MYLNPSDVQKQGLEFMGVRLGRKNEKSLLLEFHKHYGSSPLVIADMWFDLCYWTTSSGKTLLNEKEKTKKGFTRFLGAHYWLWCRPKNANVFASCFGWCLDFAQGKDFWKWIENIAALCEKKIVWDTRLDSTHTEYFAISSDGIDFKLWERKHKLYPYDSKAVSHKFKSCAAKYIVALSVCESKCVFIEGPFRGGKPDPS